MPTTITLSDHLTHQLMRKATDRQQSLNEFVIESLTAVVQENDALNHLVKKINATPSDPHMIQLAQESLIEGLKAIKTLPIDSTFNLLEWMQEWEKFEADLKQSDSPA